jgi:hypothetical protein
MRALTTTAVLVGLLSGSRVFAGSVSSGRSTASDELNMTLSMTPHAPVLGLVIAGAGTGSLATTHARSRFETFRPIDGFSYQFGTKLAVGYFQPLSGNCRITLMIAEMIHPEEAKSLSAARLSLPLHPGESATLSSEEGASIELTCGVDARTVNVKCSPNCDTHS